MRLPWLRSTSSAIACRKAIGATEVSFLIADFSGQALIRLEHAGSELAARTQGRETAERVPLAGHRTGARSPARRSRSKPATATAMRACTRP